MLPKTSRHVLYLAAVAAIGHANAQTGPVPVIGLATGIDLATGKLPPRMNINTLEQERGPMWDLFIRGLDALQNRQEGDEKSHFVLAGIHGMPYAPYNGVQAVPGGDWGGYCPHESPQLIAWHRAYLVLYEQALGDEAQRLASEYTNNNDGLLYQEASQKLRFPYWDWASDPTLPPCTTQENITVNGPDGEMVLHNPLYNYRWQTYPLNATQFPEQDDIGPVTTRDGGGRMHNIADSVKDSVYRTFSSATTYDQMASMAGSGSSFESPHNTIHNTVGGSFSSLDLTAFDPLFMLHHCNLDRLAAMWTASHENSTWQTQPFTSRGLYSTARGEIITADSPLKPFYQADGKTFHTGKSVAAIEAFGYTYADIQDGGQGRKGNVIAQINRLYGETVATEKLAVASMARHEWFVDIQVDRADMPLPCSIEVYLGDNYLAGRTSLLGMPRTGVTHDELPLPRAVDRLGIDSNEPESVERRLTRDLCVRVTKGGNVLNMGDIPSLRIKVVREDVVPSNNESDFPSYSNRTTVMVLFGTASGVRPSGPSTGSVPSASAGPGQML